MCGRDIVRYPYFIILQNLLHYLYLVWFESVRGECVVADFRFELGVEHRVTVVELVGLNTLKVLLNQQKNGQFPDETVKIKDSQTHSGDGRRY